MTHMSNQLLTSLPLAPGRWTPDSNHSSVGFTIRHLGVSKVRGHFASFDAELVVAPALAEASLIATIDVASIDPANSDRDVHVLSLALIDVSSRLTTSFRS